MSFDWADYLALAEALYNAPDSPGPEEASLRSAVSRAYYAVYCSARDFADSEGLTLRGTAGDHQCVKRYFQNDPDQLRQQIGADLDRLRDFRNRADYDDPLIVTPLSLAQLSVTMARDSLDALKAL